MKRTHVLVILAILTIFVSVRRYFSLPRVVDRVRSSVVYVQVQGVFGGRWTGSGVVLDNGLILTAQHVIADANMVSVTFDDGCTVKSHEFFISKDIDDVDLGLIIIDEADDHVNFALGTGLEIGDEVFAIGSPFGANNTVATGIFSAHNRTIAGEVLHQLDISGAPGSSGGPVFNRFGSVIGIVVRGNPYGMMYIVPLETCKAVVDVYENVQEAKEIN